ncbi:MAG: diadenylate cyclase [Puniceicoccales bacterium]|jgi:DNA integrity scanning protein DisA with diadenylate cyclase activity/mannitol/fructose-specific phosphotransferase system IIA component (Ntr-type)|nr:diadenylate cyclase [Puniceicoccales bacterium]
MNLIQYLNYDAIIEFSSRTFDGMLTELLKMCNFRGNIPETISEFTAKECEVSSHIGNKIAIPHLHVNLSVPYQIAVGRAGDDVRYGPSGNGELTNVVILVLISKHERDSLKVISSLVNLFQKLSVVDRLQRAQTFDEFKCAFIDALKRDSKISSDIKTEFNEFFLKNAVHVAREAQCMSVMLFSDIPTDNIDIESIFDSIKFIKVVQRASSAHPVVDDMHTELQVSVMPTGLEHVFRGAILLGMTKSIIAHDEKICCVGCSTMSGVLDTIVVVDVQKEFHPILMSSTRFLQCDIRPEVLERTLSIASEIAKEGREGKAVGCLFVLGDIGKISLFMKPLVLNPFYGYPESERNILNSLMDETIKEFSLIDGAFVIRGDGIVESAGTLIYTPDHNIVMPSGFGTRHAAAASISWAAECVAIAVSESTRSVTLFQNGQMLQVM